MLRYVYIAVLLSLLSGCAPLQSVDTLDGLLARVEHTYGAATQMKAVRQSGQLSSARGGSVGHVTRNFVYPDKLRIDIAFPDGRTEQRVLNAGQGWRHGRASQGPSLDAMRLQAARIGLPRLLLDQRARVRELPSDNADKSRRTLELELDDNLRIIAQIDAATGRIVASQGVLGNSSTRMIFDASYDDFRSQDGGLYAFKESHSVMGRFTGQTTLERVEVLPSLADELFMPSTMSQ